MDNFIEEQREELTREISNYAFFCKLLEFSMWCQLFCSMLGLKPFAVAHLELSAGGQSNYRKNREKGYWSIQHRGILSTKNARASQLCVTYKSSDGIQPVPRELHAFTSYKNLIKYTWNEYWSTTVVPIFEIKPNLEMFESHHLINLNGLWCRC